MAMISIDFRLLDLSIELSALDDYIRIIEKHIADLADLEEKRVYDLAKENNWDFDDPDFDFARQECYHRTNFLFPRIFRGPFLVTLYAIFEAGITEISQLIQNQLSLSLSINDRNGDFLDRAKKYFKHTLGFDLPMNDKWQHIKRLSVIRNALAHTNGRVDLLNTTTREKIYQWEKDGIGIYTDMNFILVNDIFVREIYCDVKTYLSDLIDKYKEWDTNHKFRPPTGMA